MKKVTIALLLTLMLVVITFGIASAVTDGELDGERHPYVGLMVAQDEYGNPLWRCSGTLISPTIFLTAGHCTEDPAEHVEIWFDSDVKWGFLKMVILSRGMWAERPTHIRSMTRMHSSCMISASWFWMNP